MNTIGQILLMQQQEGSSGSNYTFMIMMLLVFVVFYFFMIRPQMRRQKEIKLFRESLAKGDKIVTVGGIYGKIVDLDEKTVIIEVLDKTRLRVDKAGLVKDSSDIPPQN